MRHIAIPQYEGLTLKHINIFLNNGHEHVFDYMPDPQEIHKVSKEWICNVCATVLGGLFSGWVKNRIETRNEVVTKKKNIMIAMDPEVAAAFHASTKVSRKYHSLAHQLIFYFFCSYEGRLRQDDGGRQQAP